MNAIKLERGNNIFKNLLPKIKVLKDTNHENTTSIANAICGLISSDEHFSIEFNNLLEDTEERLQKEFESLSVE